MRILVGSLILPDHWLPPIQKLGRHQEHLRLIGETLRLAGAGLSDVPIKALFKVVIYDPLCSVIIKLHRTAFISKHYIWGDVKVSARTRSFVLWPASSIPWRWGLSRSKTKPSLFWSWRLYRSYMPWVRNMTRFSFFFSIWMIGNESMMQ